MLHKLYNNSTQVLAVSDGAREAAIRFYGIQRDRIATHLNGVDVDWVYQRAQQSIDDAWWTRDQQSQSASRVFRIVTAGRLNEQKGFHLLIDAISMVRGRHPDIEFRLAILGDGSRRENLERQIAGLNLHETVHLTGFQDNAIAWYRSADVFVLPSLIEGMPNVLLEAMACGTPVISSDCHSGPAEILQGGRFGQLIPVGSADALRDAIETMLLQSSAAEEIANAAQTYIAENWSAQSAAKRLEKVLMRCAKQGIDSCQ